MCVLCSDEFLHLCFFLFFFLHCLHLCVCIIIIGLYFLALSFLDYFTRLITKSSIDINSLWKQLFRKEPGMKLRFQKHGSKDRSTDSSEDALDGHKLSAGVRRQTQIHIDMICMQEVYVHSEYDPKIHNTIGTLGILESI